MKTSEFAGFSPETFDFLWGIRLNNNKEWFAEHKKDYVDRLYEPMKALGQAAFRPFLDRPGNLLKVSRIYRDARMHYPVPTRKVCGCVSDRTWNGGRKIPACILRFARRGLPPGSCSGSRKRPFWKPSGRT